MRRTGSIIIPITLGRAASHALRAPKTMDRWPTCGRCSIVAPNGDVLHAKGVYSVHLVDQNRRMATVLAKCHGREEALRVDFETDWTSDDLAVAMGNLTFFRSEMSR